MSRTLIDGHVHVYGCFSLATTLDHAALNFYRYSSASSDVGVLLLTQTSNSDSLQQIGDRIERDVTNWNVRSPDETSLVCSGRERRTLVMIAGRQIVTSEKLEVLALCTNDDIPCGMSLDETVLATQAAGAIAVLPWGLGKWWGERRRILRTFLASNANQPPHATALMLGDNGGRTKHMTDVSELATEFGIPILAGSDPLPITSHQRRAGSFGCQLPDAINLACPTTWIKERLTNLQRSPDVFGACRTSTQFVSDQLMLRLPKK